ncbi:probable receptor-like protein kinase At5g20050 [Miscanthus floridulus]|uniref:probable receptor-like protein kinase At5g20050 n=1 Tax=Miscanthus floridulus TaxID=154761 RepID=UPI00345998B7
MPDVEDSSPLVDDNTCCQRCCKALRTILHGVMVTPLFSMIMFAYIYLDFARKYAVASLVIQLIAYLSLGCLYICNSSGWQEKIISAAYLVLVQFVFLVSSIGIPVRSRLRVDFVSGTNIVAISLYFVWKFRLIIVHSRLKKIVRTLLHVEVVAILLFVIIVTYVARLDPYPPNDNEVRLLVQLVAYNAVGCLYIFNSSGRKEKIISAGFLFLVLLVFLLSSFANTNLRANLIFWANIVALSSYCYWKLSPWLRRCLLDAPGGAAVGPPRHPPAHQEEALLQLHPQTPFRIQEVLREFSSDEIQAMTHDFGSMIGRGGSAQVFRGNLDDGTPVAIKRINIDRGRTVAGEEDFRRELSIIANVHHRSLVRLLGYCLQRGGGLYLVYPFFENGSLDRRIFNGSDEQRRQLTWPKRLCIAVDVARALAYLHNECHWRILHLDVKPGNILLDGDLRAHVSDFGISLSITRGLNSVVNTRGRGTLGYMAPEMLINSVSDKSDVFSYGKMLLELVGGRPNFVAAVPSADDASSSATPDLKRDYFPYIVRDMMTRGELLKAVDAAMAHDGVDEEEVKTVVEVALCCIQEQPDKRPRMQDVVDMLEGRVSVNLPPESRPASAVNVLDSESSSLSGG